MKVLVLRECGNGARTAANLTLLGHEAVMLPLSENIQICEKLPDRLYRGILVTSPAAPQLLAQLAKATSRWLELANLPVHTVGARTAELARETGFTRARSRGSKASELLDWLSGEREAIGGPLLYAAPRDRSCDLEGEARRFGVSVETVDLYEARMKPVSREELSAALSAAEGGAVLLHSSRTATRLIQLCEIHGLARQLAGLTMVAISENVAAAAAGLAGCKMLISKSPNEDAMLECLKAS
ncbi:MAG: uroporphyrinogen-III synthase [Rhizobiaceae bacterium]